MRGSCVLKLSGGGRGSFCSLHVKLDGENLHSEEHMCYYLKKEHLSMKTMWNMPTAQCFYISRIFTITLVSLPPAISSYDRVNILRNPWRVNSGCILLTMQLLVLLVLLAITASSSTRMAFAPHLMIPRGGEVVSLSTLSDVDEVSDASIVSCT